MKGAMAMVEPRRRSIAALGSCLRGLAVAASQTGEPSMNIFDRKLKRKQRDRAAWLREDKDPLLDAVADTLLDRLDDCTRKFPLALNLGGSLDHVQKLLRGRGGIEKLIMMDMSLDMLKKSAELSSSRSSEVECVHVLADEEFLPLKPNSLDLVVSSLGLHWVNDLPGAMIQCRMALKPDGFFLASMFGGETLRELRVACTLAQLEREGGISPRLSPLAQVRDAGNLLTRAGLALPAVDVQDYVMKYPSAMDLIDHIRRMGDINCLLERNQILKRDTALAAAAVYDAMFREEDGTIPATFQVGNVVLPRFLVLSCAQVIYMAGWSPHPSQQKPARRGSGTVSFADIEKVFGEKSDQSVSKPESGT